MRIVRKAGELKAAIAREELKGLRGNVRKLVKNHRQKLIYMGYSRLLCWLDWQTEKHGVPVIAVNPRGSSSRCPQCGSKLRGVGYRRLRCAKCGFEEYRDVIADPNIRLSPTATHDECRPESMGGQ